MDKKIISGLVCLLLLNISSVFAQKDTIIKSLPDEYWWGGAGNFGYKMPFNGQSAFSYRLDGDASGNQSMPLLISNRGRWVWSEGPFTYTFGNGTLQILQATAEIQCGQAGSTLTSAYQYVSTKFFPSSGKLPDSLLVKAPQYNLWIELQYHPTQESVLNYADKVLSAGLPAGVLMIDDNWSNYYGQFDFNRQYFPDPAKMVKTLHAKGFKVMVWICPFISPDSEIYRELAKKKFLLMDNGGDPSLTWNSTYKPLLVHWWNGYSACLDLTNPSAKEWLLAKLKLLQTQYGIDGFKLDAGDPYFYDNPNLVSFRKVLPNEHAEKWGEIGLVFPLNEYRAMWKMAGKPLVQRLGDKNHSWEDLQLLIPNTIAQQLMGHTFTCPDMIGGGQISSFLPGSTINQKLVVRSAQVHAMMPMMQFSAAPWKILDAAHFNAVKKAVNIREQYMPELMKVLRTSAISGEPALRPLEYNYPNQGYANVKDQFMIGDRILAAPIVSEKDSRIVILPPGIWTWNGKKWKGGRTYEITVPLDELPIFVKQG